MGKTLTAILALALVPLLRAEEPKDGSVAGLPPQVTTIDDVLVPVPREIFRTFNEFPYSNWRSLQRRELATWRARGDQAQIALLLGAVIAEGFIAVQGEDAVEIKKLGRTVLSLSRGLGVEKAALKRSRSIVEYSERGEWSAVRTEWNGVLADVEKGMKELRSDQPAQLVSMGGWLRGAEVLARLVAQNYSRENAALLRQPGVFDYLEKRLVEMSANERRNPFVAKLSQGAKKFRLLFGSDDGPLSLEDVKAIGDLSKELIESLKADRHSR